VCSDVIISVFGLLETNVGLYQVCYLHKWHHSLHKSVENASPQVTFTYRHMESKLFSGRVASDLIRRLQDGQRCSLLKNNGVAVNQVTTVMSKTKELAFHVVPKALFTYCICLIKTYLFVELVKFVMYVQMWLLTESK
jgi:hypothetical protein